jgi:hypothetical protein
VVRLRQGRRRPQPSRTGLRLSSEAVARGILEREAGEKIDETLSVADPSLWKEDGGPSHAERMLKCDPKRPNAIVGPRFKPADNQRVNGWQQMYDRLKWQEMDTAQPMLYVTENCTDWWRTVPALMHDEHRHEDVDTGWRTTPATTRATPAWPGRCRASRSRSAPTGPKPWTMDWIMSQKG